MKVAIIGAGVSGLSCALELKRNGIIPTIFEKKSCLGDALQFSCIWSRQISRPFMDPLIYLNNKYNLKLIPLSELNEIVIKAPDKVMTAKGGLGYLFMRGIEEYSLECQIAKEVDLPVTFDSYIELKDIKNDFDHVVVATANSIIARQLNVWNDTFTTIARIATVVGDFRINSSTLWLNTEYSKNAFCYLIPNSAKEATLTLIVNNISAYELDFYWKEFLFKENIKYTIIETKDVPFDCGFADKYKIDNVYLSGSAAGFTDDLIGCGAFNAIETGMLAARSIAFNADYNKLVQPLIKDLIKLHELRKMMNTFDNNNFNRFVSFLRVPLVKQYMYCNPFFKLRQLEPIARLRNKYKE
jgi:digeranylgeranylglycerophospholipid reductase